MVSPEELPGAQWSVALALLRRLEVRQLLGDVILYSSALPGRDEENCLETSPSKNPKRDFRWDFMRNLVGFMSDSWNSTGFKLGFNGIWWISDALG